MHIIPRSEHSISRKGISESALKVLYRLHKAGYQAFLVGGGVRDLLLGLHPKDFDVATDAHPEEVRKVFRNSRLIGRRFRLAHVRYGREIIEVATFRAHHDEAADGHEMKDGRIVRDNVYGTLDDDAWRRDFTVNALYYNIADYSVVDFTNGMEDLNNRELMLIGDPDKRYQEDPVRMLRAIRFSAKLDFTIHPSCDEPITRLASLLADIPAARLYEEMLKLYFCGHSQIAFEKLRSYGLFEHLFPNIADRLLSEDGKGDWDFLQIALKNTDDRIGRGLPVTPAFLFAALLWGRVRDQAALLVEQGMSDIQAGQVAGDQVMAEQLRDVSIPRRVTMPAREIWTMQFRLLSRSGKRAIKLLTHPRFRAGYDFLLLRAQVGEAPQEDADWWTVFQEENPDVQPSKNSHKLEDEGRPRRRRRRRRSSSKSE